MVQRAGLLYGLAAYTWWGLMPFYFDAVRRDVTATELLAHRIVWSMVLLAILLTPLRRWAEVGSCLRSWRTLRLLMITTILLAFNWLAYIYCALHDELVQASLGYFILPLVSIVLGMVFLGERFRGTQWLAVALASGGVATLVIAEARVPWLALMLAVSFSFYGLLRKRAAVDALAGLTVETLLLTPLSGGYLLWLGYDGTGVFGRDLQIDRLLLLGGVVTTTPLFCFGEAARRLPLTTLGFMQYLSPTLQLILAVACMGEKFDVERQVSFGLIWGALLVFTIASLRGNRRVNPPLTDL
jgi:chloramphenicol-sensitive protein RarD